jgi:hypothetical protein
MLRIFGAALAVTLAIAPLEFSVSQLTQNDAEAAATFKSALLMPGKTRSFGSGSRRCPFRKLVPDKSSPSHFLHKPVARKAARSGVPVQGE